MKTDELIKALGQMKVQTGSLACLGCGHEHNCSVHGCALIREAAAQLYGLYSAVDDMVEQRDKAVEQLRRQGDCESCKHDRLCGMDGDLCAACTTGQHWEWDGGMPHD